MGSEMTIRLDEETGGKVLAVHVSEKPTMADYERFVPGLKRLVQQNGKMRVLFDMAGFHGIDHTCVDHIGAAEAQTWLDET